MRRLIAAVLVLATTWACDVLADPVDVAVPGPALGPLEPGAIRYICDEFPFDPAILEVPATDERADTPFAAALRAMIEPPVNPIVPKTGWHLLGSDADSAEFVTGTAQTGLTHVSIEPWQGMFRAVGAGDCQPKLVYPARIAIAEWGPDPDARLSAETTTFIAQVTELDCASGKAAFGRIVGPTMAVLGDRVLLAFGAQPQVGVGAVTCQGKPPVPIRVDLGQSLGNRVLVDPAIWPPKEFSIATN